MQNTSIYLSYSYYNSFQDLNKFISDNKNVPMDVLKLKFSHAHTHLNGLLHDLGVLNANSKSATTIRQKIKELDEQFDLGKY